MSFLNINPVFLFILFAMGYIFGLLLKNPTAGKFIIFGFCGIFIYEPVRDAGLFASAMFLTGILAHHISATSIIETVIENLPRINMKRAKSYNDYEEPHQDEPQGEQQNTESADETYRKYEEHVNNKRKEDAEKKAREQASDNLNAQREAMRKEQERMRREQAKVDAARERFAREQASHFAVDERSHEEVLGLTGHYSFDDLKKARSREVRRWNPSNMVNKPKHLVKQAEEEMKMINLAYDALKKKF